MAGVRRARVSGRATLPKSTLRSMRAIVPDVAHALVRAVFALLRTQSCHRVQPGVHTSVNAARRIACATIIFAALLFADSQSDVVEVFASMAAGISDNN